MNKDVILKVKDAAKISGKNEDFIRAEIRKGNLPAIKRGTEWIIQKKELDKYLGIEINDESIAKDIKIMELEKELQIYKTKVITLEGLIKTANSVIAS